MNARTVESCQGEYALTAGEIKQKFPYQHINQ